MMEQWIKRLVGQPVSVWTVAGQTEHCDHGVLLEITEQFLCMRKGIDILFFPLMRVRLLKPQDSRALFRDLLT